MPNKCIKFTPATKSVASVGTAQKARGPLCRSLHALGNKMPSQKDICKKFEAIPFPSLAEEKIGIAIQTIGQSPINGLRHLPENGTCGWYIWCGEEMLENVDFFKPLHVSHITDYLPEVEKYLSLPPGYRFLVTNEYEDIWHDSSITSM